MKNLLEEKFDFGNIVARSEKMQAVLEIVSRIAKNDSTVYIQGESGTGKELVAKAIHLASDRQDKPFIALNCAAIPETLLESKLFGHEKGAFTGAIADKQGKLASELVVTPQTPPTFLIHTKDDKTFVKALIRT